MTTKYEASANKLTMDLLDTIIIMATQAKREIEVENNLIAATSCLNIVEKTASSCNRLIAWWRSHRGE